jgi:hypothetical protein
VDDDDRYFTVDGQRWRRSDPSIPDGLRAELVRALMAARRLQDRPRTHDAKLALGERGRAWWEPRDTDADRARLAATMRTLLHARGPGKTICPSDAARVTGGTGWRALLPTARDVARHLAARGELEVTQGGEVIDAAGPWDGPVRLRTPQASRRDSTCPTDGADLPSSTSR